MDFVIYKCKKNAWNFEFPCQVQKRKTMNDLHVKEIARILENCTVQCKQKKQNMNYSSEGCYGCGHGMGTSGNVPLFFAQGRCSVAAWSHIW
jgi:hypothetical protein